MAKNSELNLLAMVTGYARTIVGAINNLCSCDWISQSRPQTNMATLSADQVRKILNSSALSDQQITELVALMEEFAWALLA